jgi:gas vesicle protein
MRKRDRNVAVGTFLVAGLAYVAGILTAPKSGRETRKDIQKAALRAKAEAEVKLKQLHSELDDLIATAKATAKTAKFKAQAGYEEALKKAEVARSKAKEVLSALHEGDTSDEDLQSAIAEVKSAAKHLKKYLKHEDKVEIES